MSRGFVPHDRPIPAPDMSFVRLFSDTTIGWQLRGQYAFWNGASPSERRRYELLERIGNRVAPIRYDDGRAVFHRIKAWTPFLVVGLAGYWLAFDTDAMWLDVPNGEGQYAILAVGGAAGKPGSAVVDWTCTGCGHAIAALTLAIGPLGFSRFLGEADAYAAAFNESEALRTCGRCGATHQPAPGLIREGGEPEASVEAAV